MKRMHMILGAGALAIATLAGGFGIGYLAGQNDGSVKPSSATQPQERKILYYRNPMGLPDTSPVPKKDSMGMDYIPVYANEAPSTVPQGERRILYYRNPMGLPDTSPVPKKDSMGMDYIPVYEGEESGSTVTISPEKVQMLGVTTAPVERRALIRTVRAVGTVQVNERGQYALAPKFEGWIEKLHVNTTGEAVRKGQPLMEVYSPELVSAQQEFLIAQSGHQALAGGGSEARQGMAALSQAALARLRNWDIGEAQLERLRRTGEITRTLTITAPVSGVVMEKPSVEGMRFQPGTTLYQITNLDTVWLIAEVFEQDLSLIRPGQDAALLVSAYPGTVFQGEVTFVYPNLTPETRTVKVRIELPNPNGLLKPAMFATVELATGKAAPVLAVPDSAVIDSGTRQVALVALGEGRFEPRELRIGQRADGYLEVLEGLAEGEQVVTRANFLIDAESNLKAALSGMSSSAPTIDSLDHDAHAHGADGSPADAGHADHPAPHGDHHDVHESHGAMSDHSDMDADHGAITSHGGH